MKSTSALALVALLSLACGSKTTEPSVLEANKKPVSQVDPGTVSGALTVGGKATQLNYGYVIDYGDHILIFLTDKPMTHDEADDSNTGNLMKEKSLRGFRLHVKKDTKNLLEAVGFHEAIPIWSITALDTLTFDNFDDKAVAGRLLSGKTEKWNDVSYTYDVKFKLPVNPSFDPAAVRVLGKGIDTGPGKVFAEYHKETMTGSNEALKGYISEALPESYRNSDSLAMLQSFKMLESPVELTIKTVDVQADTATLTVEGSRRGKTAFGTIKMKLENGKWKIFDENWKND